MQARAEGRGLFSAALLGTSFGLALGATYLIGGLDRAVADHAHAVRIARQAGGTLSETMLQREVDRLDPAALTLARAHDALAAADAVTGPLVAWPGRYGTRFPVGSHASALDNARDLTCLTEAVYFEARGETPRGQAAVAQVVLNRVASPNFPKSICGVVFQGATHAGCQFSFACDGSMRRGLETAAWDRARQIAERALAGMSGGGIGSATHFHTVDVAPDWGPQMIRVAQVGLHIFYRPNPHAAALAQQALAQQAAAQRPAVVEHAVMTSQAYAPATQLRIASTLSETTPEAAPTSPAPQAKSAESEGVPAAADSATP